MVDLGALLRTARQRAHLTQGQLAAQAGTSKAQISRYESGKVSPTVAAFERLLAYCGVEARVELQPLLADLDSRVDVLLAGDVVLQEEELAALALTLEDHPAARYPMYLGKRPSRAGRVTWAFDGHTALQLHGLAAPGEAMAVAVVLDQAARLWLRAIGARLMSDNGQLIPWLDSDPAELAEAARAPFFTLSGMVQLRIVGSLPPTLMLAAEWSEAPVPVVTTEAVEAGFSHLADVLARMRVRRSLQS